MTGTQFDPSAYAEYTLAQAEADRALQEGSSSFIESTGVDINELRALCAVKGSLLFLNGFQHDQPYVGGAVIAVPSGAHLELRWRDEATHLYPRTVGVDSSQFIEQNGMSYLILL